MQNIISILDQALYDDKSIYERMRLRDHRVFDELEECVNNDTMIAASHEQLIAKNDKQTLDIQRLEATTKELKTTLDQLESEWTDIEKKKKRPLGDRRDLKAAISETKEVYDNEVKAMSAKICLCKSVTNCDLAGMCGDTIKAHFVETSETVDVDPNNTDAVALADYLWSLSASEHPSLYDFE
eukprot:GHVO01027869.1.p1 GENE.GHVO01027869.1~~GHVO01027869.1.p1  ORF type:complete len:190 (-),score=48.78 GHVO01027869.1:534-1082(-)